jgi:hypothetical protein
MSMPDSVFNLSLWIVGPLIIGSLSAFGIVGLLFVRRFILPRLKIRDEDTEFIGAMMQSVMVFYGLALALIAVAVSQTYSDASKTVSQEVISIGSFYRHIGSYPEPTRGEVQAELRNYLKNLIEIHWPAQMRGDIKISGMESMGRIQAALVRFEPSTGGQKVIHSESFRIYNQLINSRILRIDAVHNNLPGLMWAVIIIGAFISLSSAFFFKVGDARLHGILVTLLALFVGLVIFMVFALDHPFSGDLGIPSTQYETLYNAASKAMKNPAASSGVSVLPQKSANCFIL